MGMRVSADCAGRSERACRCACVRETGPSARLTPARIVKQGLRLNAKETWCACVCVCATRWLVKEAVEAASRVEIADGRPFKRACAG